MKRVVHQAASTWDEGAAGAAPHGAGAEVSLFRLYLLRAVYALIFVGLALDLWPGVVNHVVNGTAWELRQGVVVCVLVTISLLGALGIRYPLKMLPLLFFEFIWKALWLAIVALPLWTQGAIDEKAAETVFACAMGVVIVPIAIPWRYVFTHYLRGPGDRWW